MRDDARIRLEGLTIYSASRSGGLQSRAAAHKRFNRSSGALSILRELTNCDEDPEEVLERCDNELEDEAKRLAESTSCVVELQSLLLDSTLNPIRLHSTDSGGCCCCKRRNADNLRQQQLDARNKDEGYILFLLEHGHATTDAVQERYVLRTRRIGRQPIAQCFLDDRCVSVRVDAYDNVWHRGSGVAT